VCFFDKKMLGTAHLNNDLIVIIKFNGQNFGVLLLEEAKDQK